MINPIGTTEDGTVVFTTSPDAIRAAGLFAQLENWRIKGYNPQLWGMREGWALLIDMTRSGMQNIGDPNSTTMLLRFNTGIYATPQEAIKAALEVIQP